MSGELAKMENSQLANSMVYNPTTPYAELIVQAEYLIATGMLPKNLNVPGQVVAIGQLGYELGFTWMVALNNIDNIQGKPTLSYRAVGTLLRRNNFEIRLIADWSPVQMADGTIDYITTIEMINHIARKEAQLQLIEIAKLPEDVRKYALEAYKHQEAYITKQFTYSWSDAARAGYLDKPGSNWIKIPREMMRARCVTAGTRIFAPHVMMDLYESTELDPTRGLDGGVEYTHAEVVE